MRAFEKYIAKAKKMGALDTVLLNASDVAIDYRTHLKCMYGCEYWNCNWTCPSAPNALRPWEFEKILKKYRWAILIHCDNQKTSQRISYELERDAFVDGYYFALSMSDCALCKKCAYPEPCRHSKKARPSMQALGIDVYATARKQGLPISTLKNTHEPQNWYSVVLLE